MFFKYYFYSKVFYISIFYIFCKQRYTKYKLSKFNRKLSINKQRLKQSSDQKSRRQPYLLFFPNNRLLS